MYSQPPPPPSLKRSVSGESQSSHASQVTTVSRSSSKLLFGEIPLTPATTVEGGRSTRSNSSICNLVLSTNSTFLRFWLNETCRENLLGHLDPEDMPNFRLVCHDFSHRAAPSLFEYLTVTFRPSTFTKPARMEALSRLGRHVKTLTFHMPHDANTFLPPIIDPSTGAEKQFIYAPQIELPPNIPGREQTPKYGSAAITDLLLKQYPPLFHAATNVPAFIAAFSHLPALTHLKISCPGSDTGHLQYRRTAVDYALISLRIAVERAPLFRLHTLSMLPIHPGGLLYLSPMQHGFGSTRASSTRWAQIRRLAICMESIHFSSSSARVQSHSLEHLRILHAYLRTLSRGLTRLFFRWKGERGPSPLSLDREPCMLPPSTCASPCICMHPGLSHRDANTNMNVHPSQRGTVRGPRPLRFSALRYMELENAVMDSSQIADFIYRHRRSLVEFDFEDVKLRQGSWEEALEPLTGIAGGDGWKGRVEEVMDVPIVLGGMAGELRVLGMLGAGDESGDRDGDGEGRGRARSGATLAKWLGKRAGPQPGAGVVPRAKKSAKESFLGSEHMKRFLRGSMFPSWR